MGKDNNRKEEEEADQEKLLIAGATHLLSSNPDNKKMRPKHIPHSERYSG